MNTYVEAMDLMEKVTEPQLCSLEEARLHSIDNREYGLLPEKLHAHRFHDEAIDLLIIFQRFSLFRELRNVVKVQLHQYEIMGAMSDTFSRKTDGEVAQLGKALHNRLEEMMWDTLTLQGQADLTITDVRETKLVECLTPSFASTVKNAGNLDIVMDFILILLSLRKTF